MTRDVLLPYCTYSQWDVVIRAHAGMYRTPAQPQTACPPIAKTKADPNGDVDCLVERAEIKPTMLGNATRGSNANHHFCSASGKRAPSDRHVIPAQTSFAMQRRPPVRVPRV